MNRFLRITLGWRRLALAGLLFALAAGAAGREESGDLAALRKKAKAGDAESQSKLGSAFYEGAMGANQDYQVAVYWYQMAAAQGHANAAFNLGICYEQGKGVEKNPGRALDLYMKAADKGLVLAQLNAGLTLRDEFKNDKQAAHYFMLGARQGHIVCQREYGIMRLHGRGVKQDFDIGQLFLARAAQAGDVKAQLSLADAYGGAIEGIERDVTKMIDYLWQAASRDEPEALAKVGFCYEEGIGLTKDVALAAKWYRRAAELGFPQAMLNLASLYNRGSGVPPDANQAFSWYQRAAQTATKDGQKLPLADYNLGVAYTLGRGARSDAAKAFKHFKLAAETGLARAQYNLAIFYHDGQGVDADPSLAYYWFKQAAGQGDPQALTGLGHCYLDAVGVDRDRQKARDCFQRAAALGDEEAARVLKTRFRD